MTDKIKNTTEKILASLDITSASGIDLAVITRASNIKLKASDLDDSISGFFVIKNGVANIVYNKYQSPVRQRFTIAHELGHFVLHKKELSLSKTELPVFRNGRSSTGENKQEREANLFAASLLMPENFIEDELKNFNLIGGSLLEYLAGTFKVSEQAMSYRLAYLNYDLNAIF